MTDARLLDTNVLIHANGNQSPQTSLACIQCCKDQIGQVLDGEIQVVLDLSPSGSAILEEYKRNLSPRHHPLGNRCLQWLLRYQGFKEHVVWVTLKPTGIDSYREWPDHPDLTGFDPRDRKWIAAANAHQQQFDSAAIIVQSAEGEKWKRYVPTFSALGITIDFICDEV